MPRFEPFPGLRYDPARIALDDVIAPPYDVIDDDDQAALEAKSPYNAVWVELSRDEPHRDRYEAARCRLEEWIADGVLRPDGPSFYVVQMRFTDEAGRPRRTTGVLGALELVEPDEGGILPHERTTPKAKGDRLFLLRSCRANLSPIWGLSLTDGLSDLLHRDRDPDARATDEAGIEHLLWVVDDPAAMEKIRAAVASTPIVVADGHHRYETALAFRDEMRAERGAGPWDFLLTYVVELVESELTVRAIHRLIAGLPEGFDLVTALSSSFEPTAIDTVDTILERMEGAGSLCLITATGAWLLRPTPALDEAAEHDLDSSRLDVALATLPEHRLTYQHGWDLAARAVARGDADAAVLIRPATVAQIAEVGHGGLRMPPKTTFFHPKPRTGLVFRTLEEGAGRG